MELNKPAAGDEISKPYTPLDGPVSEMGMPGADALEKIREAAQIDAAGEIRDVVNRMADVDSLRVGRGLLGEKLDQDEQNIGGVEDEYKWGEKKVEEHEKQMTSLEAEIESAEEEARKIRMDLARNRSGQDILNLGLETEEAKLKYKLEEIENDLTAKLRVADDTHTSETEAVLVELNPKIKEAREIKAEYEKKAEKAKVLETDEARKVLAALEERGQGAAVAQALRQVEDDKNIGLKVAGEQYDDLVNRMEEGKRAADTKFELETKRLDGEAEEKRTQAKSGYETETGAMRQRLVVLGDEEQALIARLEDAEGGLLEKKQRLERLSQERGQWVEGQFSVLRAMGELEMEKYENQDRLGRVMEKLDAAELAGVEATKRLEAVIQLIGDRREVVLDTARRALTEIDKAVDSMRERIRGKAAAERRKVQGREDRVVTEIEEVLIAEHGWRRNDKGVAVMPEMGVREMFKFDRAKAEISARMEAAMEEARRSRIDIGRREGEQLSQATRESIDQVSKVFDEMIKAGEYLGAVEDAAKGLRDMAEIQFGIPQEKDAQPVFLRHAKSLLLNLSNRFFGQRRKKKG